ncbi:Ppx/GppA family phosphatase [Erythrobacter sanguineus]|uniref:Exopolyphosphatase / guanosine-5'-triphosphate,3'-diphosphate pyrophosphatase n=1 Tax=Erythrobacter sanguineus TaxID=198312 RepID=A0A1M7RZT4_9SPHN|nr:Ppx/GppA family phosphatase [Erythrobacter sanguineus]SHN51839.1 exopolyphosphatase / guanosine-5'-triphosphate,3'-diphosphate pyrophosphatase [Erythrobacter sanguineus]
MTYRKRRDDRDGAFAGNTPERAIIDIGSNTVRLVVYGGAMRAPMVLLNEKVTAKLGREIAATGRLADEAMALALRGLKRFALLLDDLGIEDVETVATAAVRDASNGPEFAAQLRAIGLEPRVISGEEEALLSAHGVIGAFPDARGIVADLGGGSLELVRVASGMADGASTLPLGTLRLPDYRPDQRKGMAGRAEMKQAIDKVIRKAGWDLSASPSGADNALYLVGGTWRAMAVFAMALRGHPLSDPHGFELDAAAAQELAETLADSESEALKGRDRISSMRAEKLPDAAVLLSVLLARINPARVVFSSWGLREGLLYDRLPAPSRAQDPLLAGIAMFASQRGAPVTLATRMAAWTLDAAPAREHGSERLRLAAIMLGLASMQVEPNLRLPQAIDWALHKRWVGVDGMGRAMMAAAVAANGNSLDLPARVRALASEEALEEAARWGLALRLARRLGARSRRSLEVSRLVVQDGALLLKLAESHEALFGIPSEKDMKLLAGRLGLEWRMAIVPDAQLRGD